MIQIQIDKIIDSAGNKKLLSSKLFAEKDAAGKHIANLLLGTTEFGNDNANCYSKAIQLINELDVNTHEHIIPLVWDNNETELVLTIKYLGAMTRSEDIHTCWREGDKLVDIYPAHYEKLNSEFQMYIDRIKSKEDCVDSLRIGLISNPDSMKSYEALKSCCGQDDIIINIDGVEYMMGCNYGH